MPSPRLSAPTPVIACDDGRLDAQAVLSDRGMFAAGMNEARPLPALRPHWGLFANGESD